MRRKYTWEDWFDQQMTTLKRGVDYQCSQSTMAQSIRNNASMRGVSIQLTDTGDGFVIIVVGGNDDAVPRTDGAAVTG